MSGTYVGTWWIADHRAEADVRRVEGTLTIGDDGRADLRTSEFFPLLLEPVESGVLEVARLPREREARANALGYGLRVHRPPARDGTVVVGVRWGSAAIASMWDQTTSRLPARPF